MVSEDWRSIDIDALEPDAHLTKEDLLPTDIPPTTIELGIRQCSVCG